MTAPDDTACPPLTPPPPAAAPAASAALVAGSLDRVVERFARDYLKEKRSERRWSIFFRLAWLVLFGGLVLTVARLPFHETG